MKFGEALVLAALLVPFVATASGASAQMPPAAAAAPPARLPGPAATPRIERTGTFVLDLDLTVSPDLPDGTVVSIGPSASAADTGYGNEIDLLNVSATVSGHKVSAAFEMPYTWLVAATTDKVSISVYVEASATNGSLVYSSYYSFAQTIPLPNNGATTPIRATGSL